MVQRVARVLCMQARRDPDALEAGDVYGIDGRKPNGDPAHYNWREYVGDATEIILSMARPNGRMVDAAWKTMTTPPVVAGIYGEMMEAALFPPKAAKP